MTWNYLSNYKTAISASDGKLRVTFHSTDIVTWTNDTITLNCGGWMTSTTKNKMNQASHQFDLGFIVEQRNNKWWVHQPDASIHEFYDGITFARS